MLSQQFHDTDTHRSADVQKLVWSAPFVLKVVLEFDFKREARVMDNVADNLKVSK